MLSVALTLALAASAAPTTGITPEMEAHLQKGLDGIYSMDFDGAEKAARAVTELNPEHPHGWFGVAAVAMMRYVYDTEQGDPALIKLFEERMEFAAKKAEDWIEKHPDDAEAMMIYGACFGVRGRLQIVRKQWVKGYFSARKAIAWQRESLKKDPQLYDAYLGIGMYDYYTDVYPSVIGVLSKIMLRGDRLRGVAELKLAAEKGRFSNVVADLLLVEIGLEDLYGLRDPAQAVTRMGKLRKRYPDSAMLHGAEISALYEAERWEEARKSSEEFLSRVASGKYKATQKPKGHVLLGTPSGSSAASTRPSPPSRTARRRGSATGCGPSSARPSSSTPWDAASRPFCFIRGPRSAPTPGTCASTPSPACAALIWGSPAPSRRSRPTSSRPSRSSSRRRTSSRCRAS